MSDPRELNYKLTEAKADLVKGEHSQEAIVNQEPKENVVNTITVDEVKEIAEEQLQRKDKVLRFFVNNIKAIDEKILDKLECGDIVVKITHQSSRKMHHCYIVSYYEHKHGCCLTYTAAGYIETQSYDYTDGHWVYNSQDLWQAE